jgi:phosphotriesterase-related protein
VLHKVIPELEKLKAFGVQTLVECTPAYLGRDVRLLRRLSDTTGLQILTNTGYYGAQNNRFIPSDVLLMSAEELSKKWIEEYDKGIDGTGIRPGFIKIGVDGKALSEFHATLVRAAALTHKATGLTIMAHTGPAIAAFQELDILKEEGVSPEAFIWTHATDEKDWSKLVQAAKMGAWISADNYGWNPDLKESYPQLFRLMKEEGVLNRLLVSHDAGWYDPGQPEQPFKPYTLLFEELIPDLKKIGFTGDDMEQLLVDNPGRAFAVRKRLIKN